MYSNFHPICCLIFLPFLFLEIKYQTTMEKKKEMDEKDHVINNYKNMGIK
jgi:hypothetical protein